MGKGDLKLDITIICLIINIIMQDIKRVLRFWRWHVQRYRILLFLIRLRLEG
jgi:hypothetical protein